METTPPPQQPQQNLFEFNSLHDDGKTYNIKFNSVFDSGNMKEVLNPSLNTVKNQENLLFKSIFSILFTRPQTVVAQNTKV